MPTQTPLTAADTLPAAQGPGRVDTAARTRLRIAARCLAGCGELGHGYAGDPPANRRYDSRWAELNALADVHVKQHRHAASCGAGPEVAR